MGKTTIFVVAQTNKVNLVNRPVEAHKRGAEMESLKVIYLNLYPFQILSSALL